MSKPSRELYPTTSEQVAFLEPDYIGETTQLATHRFRLYQYHGKGLQEGEFLYTIVWDTVEQPYDEDIPQGELIFDFNDSSFSVVRQEAQRFCQEHDIVEVVNVRDLGSL
jgi:hypothetical protein